VPADDGGTYAGLPVPPAGGVPDGTAGVPVLGVAGMAPLETPVSGVVLLLLAFAGVTGLPVEIGGGGAWNVSELELELPPLEAIAITTIRKKAATAPSATSLRRR
jgi:hypothetical protein